jgi:predicted Fe-Mo cluster-binding NifX family protein
MKIAISSTGPDIESEVDPRFGRCQYFMIVDLDDMSFEAVPNTNLAQGSGVGIQSAKVVADKGVKAVLTGSVGPHAHQALSAARLDVMTGVSGTVREAAQQYKNGQLQPAEKSDVQNHISLQTYANQPRSPWPQQATDSGLGMGRGMGCGRGMGMGRGMGGGLCGRRAAQPSGGVTREKELAHLKEDARMLRAQMDEIQRRIKELENEKP